MSDAAYENKPQHLVCENGEFSVRVEANCPDLTWAAIVRGVMEPLVFPDTAAPLVLVDPDTIETGPRELAGVPRGWKGWAGR